MQQRSVRCLRSLMLAAWIAGTVSGCEAPESTEPSNGLVQTTESSVLVRGARVVDVVTGTLTGPHDLLIVDGVITRVEPSPAISESQATTVLDAEGLFALPGLIDVHAHLGDGGIGQQTEGDREGALAQFLRYGVTTIFAPGGGGGNDEDLARWKRRCRTQELVCPGLYGSGSLITAPGSHPIGTLWDFPDDVDPALVEARGGVAIAEDEPADPLIARKQARGVDAIKIVIEDGPGPWVPKPRLSNTKIAELVEASHQRGLRVYAHVSMPSHVEDGVAAGIDGVMHSAEEPIPQLVLDTMADEGIFYVATLALYDGFAKQSLGQFEEEPFARAGVSRRALESLEDEAWRGQPADPPETIGPMWQALHDNLLRAAESGVPLALGTDVNNPTVFPGYSAHEELALMVGAGLTPAQALRAATVGSATFLGKEATLGRIAPGYEADLLLLTENPLDDILNTRTLHTVLHDGIRVEGVVSSKQPF